MKLADLCAGDFKDPLALQTGTLSADGQGGQTISWATTTTPWAKIVPWRGHEAMFAGQTRHTITHRAYVRYDSTIVPTMRASLGSRLFQIVAVIDLEEAHEFMELLLEEGEAT